MAKKVIAKASTATSALEKHNRLLKRKLESEIGEKNHEAEQRHKIHNMLFKTQAAVRDQKAQEMCTAVSFYAAKVNSDVWNTVDTDVQDEYCSIERECYPILRKDHLSQMQPGVDICITIRDETASQHVQHVLRQIADAIQLDYEIAYCSKDDEDYDQKPSEVINGILIE